MRRSAFDSPPGFSRPCRHGYPQQRFSWWRVAPDHLHGRRLWVFNDSRWSWWSFDFDKDVERAVASVGPAVDQVSTDLSAIQARGGRAIVYQGWQDPVVNAVGTIAYL